jgi:APA family basic amino acid/polyamine antiporter
MLVNYLLMCLSVIVLPFTNPEIAKRITVFKSIKLQRVVAGLGVFCLGSFLWVHISKDFSAPVEAWYFHSTPVWLIVMLIASSIFLFYWKRLKRMGVDTKTHFANLPAE